MKLSKWQLAYLIQDIDRWCHRHKIGPPRWLCDAADICYGVGPEELHLMIDGRQARKPSRLDYILYRWLHGPAGGETGNT